nr:MAG TPA: Commissureless [Caudoviricetes sp.]
MLQINEINKEEPSSFKLYHKKGLPRYDTAVHELGNGEAN